MANCPICQNSDVETGRLTGGDFKQYSCPRCGDFEITGSASAMLPSRLTDEKVLARLSHALRVAEDSEEWPRLSSVNLDEMAKRPLPSLERKTFNLLRWASNTLGDDQLGVVELPPLEHLAGIVGTIDGNQVDDLISLAVKQRLLDFQAGECISITAEGWRLVASDDKPTSPTHVQEMALTPASSGGTEIVSAHCNECRGSRNAYQRAIHTIAGSDGEVNWTDTFEILECCGCEEMCVRHQRWVSENDTMEHDGSGQLIVRRHVDTSYWPPPARRSKPDWVDKVSDDNLRALIDELYVSLNAGLLVFSTTGARTLFDRASFLQIGDPPGGFAGKLSAMVSAGYISPTELRILEAMTDVGSASAHRGFAPTFEQLNAVVDILENYLERAFVLSETAEALRRATPPRSR